jgi:uncharacterized membrane protein YgaE (UPF0421/DUF939 family)
MMEVIMGPFTVLFVVLIVGYVVARVVISNKQYKRRQKSYLMIVRHGGQEFRSSCVASSRTQAENTLHQEITQQIQETGLNPFDGTTEYRLFGETIAAVLPEKMMVFRPEKRQG